MNFQTITTDVAYLYRLRTQLLAQLGNICPCTICVVKNVDRVQELIQSQDNWPQTHLLTNFRKLRIYHTTVTSIIHNIHNEIS